GDDIGTHVKSLDAGSAREHNETYPWRGLKSQVTNHFREMTLRVAASETKWPSYEVVIRAYDQSVAYRYHLPGGTITGEASSWTLPAGSTVYFQRDTSSYEGLETHEPIEKVSGNMGCPVTIKIPGPGGDAAVWAAITESALNHYSGMSLTALAGSRTFHVIFKD